MSELLKNSLTWRQFETLRTVVMATRAELTQRRPSFLFVRCRIAMDYCAKYFVKVGVEIMAAIASQRERPSLTLICDEARITKRDVLMTLLTCKGSSKVFAAPLQCLPDVDETTATTEEKKANLFEAVSHQFQCRVSGKVEQKQKPSHVVPQAPSKTLYQAASNAVHILVGLTFSLCRPHHQFRAIKPNEQRRVLEGSRFHYFESGEGEDCWRLICLIDALSGCVSFPSYHHRSEDPEPNTGSTRHL
jgi:hypothetical protein